MTTVKELIQQLSEFNPDAEVSLSVTGIICSEDITLGYIVGEQKDRKFEHNKQTTKQVFIEGVDIE